MNPRSRVSTAALISVLAFDAREARANEPSREAPEPSQSWYGWQTLMADGASTLLLGASFAVAGPYQDDAARALAILGLGAYGLGAPGVHLANAQPWRAAASLGLRIGVPAVAGMFTGAVARTPSCTRGGIGPCMRWVDPFFTGVLVGMGAAAVIDAALLAWKPEERKPAATGLSITPQIDPVHKTYGLSVGGAAL